MQIINRTRGVKNLKILSSSELKIREPYVSSKKTLLVPEEGIIDYMSVMKKFTEKICNNNGIFL